MINPFKAIGNYFAGHIGSWSYFIGTCVADGFNDRMADIQEEEDKLHDETCEECKDLELKPVDTSGGGHGAN